MPELSPLNDLTAQAGANFVEDHGWSMPTNYGSAVSVASTSVSSVTRNTVEEEYQAAKTSAVVFDLSHRGKIEVSGEEAATFLHNLCTNDIKEMPIGVGCEAFLTSSTAKVIAFLRIYHVLLHGGREAFFIDTEPGESEKVIQHLDRFLISEAVEFADRTREFALMRLAGPQSKLVLEKALLDDLPNLEEHFHMERTFGTSAHSHVRQHDPLALGGYDVLCLREPAVTVWQMLIQAGAKPAGLEAHELLRVEAGTPVNGIDMDENRFVVEVDRVEQSISYNKGCFLGQEPIVMARDRGQVQRRLLGVKIAGAATVPGGTKLINSAGKDVGVITSSVISPVVGPIGLAYVKRAHQEPGSQLECDVNGERIKVEVVRLPIPGTR